MKSEKISYFKKLLNSYHLWKSMRNEKVLNKMVAWSMDEAIRLANKKRDITNHVCWCVSGNGEHLVFLRYQKKSLQAQGLLKPLITSKELNEKASYVALPYTNANHKRGGIFRKYLNK